MRASSSALSFIADNSRYFPRSWSTSILIALHCVRYERMGLEEGDTHGCQSSFDCFTFTSRKKLRGFATHLDRTIWNIAVTSR
jgi:hypothetical protein